MVEHLVSFLKTGRHSQLCKTGTEGMKKHRDNRNTFCLIDVLFPVTLQVTLKIFAMLHSDKQKMTSICG